MKPTLIYLPGLHGESSLFSGLHDAASGALQVEKIDYPRAGCQGVSELGEHVLQTLVRRGIRRGWVLAESFGSLVIWELVERIFQSTAHEFQVEGIILAGGFIRHPRPRMVARLRTLVGWVPDWAYRSAWHISGRLLATWYWRNPGRVASVKEFVRHRCLPGDRSTLDQRAAWIVISDPRSSAAHFPGPVFQLSGGWDFIVPWGPVTRELQKITPGYRGRCLIWSANHGVLFEQPDACVKQILRWIQPETPDPV